VQDRLILTPLGGAAMPATKTDEYLASIFADSFKREIDGDEAIWRSLPFFAAIIGLAVAVLPSIFQSGVSVSLPGWQSAFYILFGLSLIAFAWAGFWFARVVRVRDYRFLPLDTEILAYADRLRGFYQRTRVSDEEADERIREDLRRFMIRELAAAAAVNRANNRIRSNARNQVLLFALIGFLFAFLSEGPILIAQVLK
jgi:hypothetical protein